MKWYSLKEIEEMSDGFLTRSYLLDCINNRTIANTSIKGNGFQYVVREDDVNKLLDDYEYSKKCYSLKQISNLLGYSRGYTFELIKNNGFDYRTIKNTFYSPKDGIDSYIQEGAKIKSEYFSSKEASKLLNLSISHVIKVSAKFFPDKTKSYKNEIYIQKEAIYELLKDYVGAYQLSDIKRISGKSQATVSEWIREGLIPGCRLSKYRDIFTVDKEKFDKFVLSNDYKLLVQNFNSNNIVMDFENYIRLQYSKYTLTKDIYIEWGKNKLNISNANQRTKRSVKSVLISLHQKMQKSLVKEIFEYSDHELEMQFFNPKDESFSAYFKKELGSFLEYCKSKYGEKCRYKKRYITVYSKGREYKEDEIYSKEEWFAYYSLFIDVERLFKKALINYKYAQIWLYGILHFSNNWRKSDLENLPSLPIEMIGIKNLEDLSDFTMLKAQTIVNEIISILKHYYASKNGQRLYISIPLDFVFPVAVAYVLCELHRREKGNKYVLHSFRTSNIEISDWTSFTDNLDEKPLSNRKANHSFATYTFETAVKYHDTEKYAYTLNSILRAHKISNSMKSETTSIYIKVNDKDGPIMEASHHISRRGHFGWLYQTIVTMVYEVDKWTQEDVTQAIERIKEEYTPSMIENMSEFLRYKYKEISDVLKELILMEPSEIKERIHLVLLGQSPSRTEHCQCFINGGNPIKSKNRCPNKERKSCLGCKYLIPTVYTLLTLKHELFDIIEKAMETSNEDINTILKYQHMLQQLLFILQEAKAAFFSIDKDYIKSFIDFKELKEKLDVLESKKFSLIGM